MAKKKPVVEEEVIKENISVEPLETVMSTRYATYAKYVIQDRAIPDVRDGLKPVQRRIIYAMFTEGNTINKPTRKCAHTVGAVMGKYHPHGDSSIYEALARMSQDWKVRAPLVDFQGNNGSIDGDSPAAYRYTESRLSELANEMVRDLDKDTVDMQLTFDDTNWEPTVLPSRFPNLLVNGSEGIAVALATEIPPHNLREVCEATIYRINHKTCTVEDLMNFIPGPDFPTGGIIYRSEGLNQIYSTGKGRIEVACKASIEEKKNINQIIITEVPYKILKIQIVYEIDKIRHSKAVDGILEVRDESDFSGIRICVDVKKDANAELILAYLMNKTSMKTSYTANMVAIVDGRPRTLNLLEFIDAYIVHQVEVVTRKSQFDLNKSKDRLHIVEGLILASINITRVVEIIRSSKDKQDSKVNLMKEFGLSQVQAEAIVMMPLYKLSHTDELTLEREKAELLKTIEKLEGILGDPNKLNRVICKDLKDIATKYGDDRRTLIEEKEDVKPIDKRELISKDEVYFSITRDGYTKRCSPKSYNSSGDFPMPNIKNGDILVGSGKAWTTDFVLFFTNFGNYITIPVYEIPEGKWKDEGIHISTMCSFQGKERIIKAMVITNFRDDLYIISLSKNGQIKRTVLSEFVSTRRSKPIKFMRLLPSDELADVKLSTGNADVLVLSSGGLASRFNENEITLTGLKAGGVKSMSGLSKEKAVSLHVYQEDEKGKLVLFTDIGCERVLASDKVPTTSRLAKPFQVFRSFKSDAHSLVFSSKLDLELEKNTFALFDKLGNIEIHEVSDYHVTEIDRMCKKNMSSVPSKTRIKYVYAPGVEVVDETIVSQPIKVKEKVLDDAGVIEEKTSLFEDDDAEMDEKVETPVKKVEEKESEVGVEQISIFDDIDK